MRPIAVESRRDVMERSCCPVGATDSGGIRGPWARAQCHLLWFRLGCIGGFFWLFAFLKVGSFGTPSVRCAWDTTPGTFR